MSGKLLGIKLRLFFVCIVTLIIILSHNVRAYAEDVPGVTDNSVKIGLTLDQTGPAANVAVPITRGIQSYFRNINEQGGINGRKVKMLVEDDRYAIPMAITAFKKLLFKDKVFILMGPTSTGAITALSRSIKKQKVPLISIVMPQITVRPFKRYIFTIADIYPNQMKVLIDYMLKDRKPKDPRIGLVFPDSETGKVDRESALKRLESYNLAPVSREVLNPGAVDASSQIMNLKRAKVNQVLLCGGIPQIATVLLRECKKFGLNIPVFGSWAACAEEVIVTVGDAAKRYYAVNHMSSWYDDEPGVAQMRKITLKYAPGTEKPYRGKLYTHGWALGLVAIEGLKRTGKELDREAFVESMEMIRNFDTGGLCGPIGYSSKSHKGGNTWKIFKAEPDTGKFSPMTEWRRTD